ncbi:hypothetical protein [Streptosporangium roseum]|uniref:hypothetical protein n=1 Tax=Streptosporangium roseum TaxID=2001 RepID=UPI0033278E32
MSEQDKQAPGLDEVRALAATLRASIATLDTQIEQRAQKVAAERVREFYAQQTRGPLSTGDDPEEEDDEAKGTRLVHESVERMEQLGELWRQRMIRESPEAQEEIAGFPALVFTASAARLLFDICLDAHLDEQRREVRSAVAKP